MTVDKGAHHTPKIPAVTPRKEGTLLASNTLRITPQPTCDASTQDHISVTLPDPISHDESASASRLGGTFMRGKAVWQSRNLAYPSSLYDIYPTLYPHLRVYPVIPHKSLSKPSVRPPLQISLPKQSSAKLSIGQDSGQSSDESNSWPPTPCSPDRLPSASLMDRMQWSPIELAAFRQAAATKSGLIRNTQRVLGDRFIRPQLVEREWNANMRSLAECSAVSPVPLDFAANPASFEEARNISERPLRSEAEEKSAISSQRYPTCLMRLYPAVYPHFDLYPTKNDGTCLRNNAL